MKIRWINNDHTLTRYFDLLSALATPSASEDGSALVRVGQCLAGHLKHLMTQANMARFAPLTEANMKADYELALQSLEKLEGLL